MVQCSPICGARDMRPLLLLLLSFSNSLANNPATRYRCIEQEFFQIDFRDSASSFCVTFSCPGQVLHPSRSAWAVCHPPPVPAPHPPPPPPHLPLSTEPPPRLRLPHHPAPPRSVLPSPPHHHTGASPRAHRVPGRVRPAGAQEEPYRGGHRGQPGGLALAGRPRLQEPSGGWVAVAGPSIMLIVALVPG